MSDFVYLTKFYTYLEENEHRVDFCKKSKSATGSIQPLRGLKKFTGSLIYLVQGYSFVGGPCHPWAVVQLLTPRKTETGEFITSPRPTGRRRNFDINTYAHAHALLRTLRDINTYAHAHALLRTSRRAYKK